jgi:hypothetical protein
VNGASGSTITSISAGADETGSPLES